MADSIVFITPMGNCLIMVAPDKLIVGQTGNRTQVLEWMLKNRCPEVFVNKVLKAIEQDQAAARERVKETQKVPRTEVRNTSVKK